MSRESMAAAHYVRWLNDDGKAVRKRFLYDLTVCESLHVSRTFDEVIGSLAEKIDDDVMTETYTLGFRYYSGWCYNSKTETAERRYPYEKRNHPIFYEYYFVW